MVIALPLIGVVFAVAFLALLAWGPLQRLMQFVIDHVQDIPGVGGYLANAFRSMGYAVGSWIASWLDPAIRPLTDLVDFVSGTIQYWIRTASKAIAAAGYRLSVLGAKEIADVGALFGRAAAAIAADLALTARLAGEIAARLSLGLTVAGIIATRIPGAIAYAIHAAEVYAAAAVAAAEARALAEVASAVAFARSLVIAEEAARAAADAAIRAAVLADVGAVERTIGADVAALERTIGADVGTLGRAITGVESQVGAWVGPLTIAGAIAAAVAEIERIRLCNDPMCSTLSPTLGLLNGVADVVTLAILAELIASAVSDPEGAARTVAADAAPLVGLAGGIFGDLTGIRLAA
jgi:hypothetical protein